MSTISWPKSNMKTTSYLVGLFDIKTNQMILESEVKNTSQSWVIYGLSYDTEYDFKIVLKYQNSTSLTCTQRLKTGPACNLFVLMMFKYNKTILLY